MLEKIDDALTKDRYNPDGRGCSLKSWLEANCPEINYQTAKSYQRAAEGVRVLAKMAADVPLLPLGSWTPCIHSTNLPSTRATAPNYIIRCWTSMAPARPTGSPS